tara:strand:+ start:1446 stop:1886 length:441 start_codon:yes stop_codon:yes gene_type:complete
MNKLFLLLLVLLSSCYSNKENNEQTDFKTNLDSLFKAADGAVELVTNNRKQKVLLEQDLWRKKRDIKNIEKKYTDSIWNLSNMYELNTLKMDSDSVQYNYKIVLREIVDTVRMVVTDSVCDVCQTRQNKKDNRWYKKTFRWIKESI